MTTENKINTSKRKFLKITTGTLVGIGAIFASLPFMKSLVPASHKKQKTWEINIEKLLPGEYLVEIIDTKPIFIVRRTQKHLESLDKISDRLLDPDSLESDQPQFAQNIHRSKKLDIFVVDGTCTHLGCSTKFINKKRKYVSQEVDGGFYCPCHFATFDASGRVFKNMPADENLKVPDYEFIDENTIRIFRS